MDKSQFDIVIYDNIIPAYIIWHYYQINQINKRIEFVFHLNSNEISQDISNKNIIICSKSYPKSLGQIAKSVSIFESITDIWAFFFDQVPPNILYLMHNLPTENPQKTFEFLDKVIADDSKKIGSNQYGKYVFHLINNQLILIAYVNTIDPIILTDLSDKIKYADFIIGRYYDNNNTIFSIQSNNSDFNLISQALKIGNNSNNIVLDGLSYHLPLLIINDYDITKLMQNIETDNANLNNRALSYILFWVDQSSINIVNDNLYITFLKRKYSTYEIIVFGSDSIIKYDQDKKDIMRKNEYYIFFNSLSCTSDKQLLHSAMQTDKFQLYFVTDKKFSDIINLLKN